jgi:hypothetical protein
MHAIYGSSHAHMLAAATAAASSHSISLQDIGIAIACIAGFALLWRVTKRHPIIIHHHMPQVAAPAPGRNGRGGGSGGGHGLAKGVLTIGIILAGIFGVTTLMSHHPATTATATIPAVHPTVTATPSPAPTHSGSPVLPKVITKYVDAHHLLTGPQIVIAIGILALAGICVTAIVMNRLSGSRGE